jgi:DNA ligase (NAD+)
MNNLLNKENIILIPKNCPSCNSILEVKGVHLYCKNENCAEKNIQIITNWCKNCNMDKFAEATIRLLYNNNYIKSIIDLYFLKNKKNYLLELIGLGNITITNLLEQIEKSKNMTILEFLGKLSIISIGEKAVKKLGIKTIDDFWNFSDGKYVIGQNLIAYKKANKKFILDLLPFLNVTDVVDKQIKGKVCMTGSGHTDRKTLIKELETMGYEFVEGITKETNILICDDINGNSGKLQKAKKLGIKIVSYEEFFK